MTHSGALARRLPAITAIAAGISYPLGFAPLALVPLSPLALGVLFFLWRDAGPRRAAWLGGLFGCGAFGVGISWVYVSLHQYGNMPAPLALAVVGVFVLLMALYPALAGGLQALFTRASGNIRLVAVMPALWVLLEWLRGQLFSGFPWLYLGYTQVDTPLAALLPLGGVLTVSLLMAVATACLVGVVAGERRQRLQGLGVLMALSVVVFVTTTLRFVQPVGDAIRVAIVQENISLAHKWEGSRASAIAQGYLEASQAERDADLVVWPEVALPVYLDQVDPNYLQALAQHPADFLLGVMERQREGDGWHLYNSALGIGDTMALYRKRQLVPFGEYLPLQSLLGWLLVYLQIPMSDFIPWAGGPQPMQLAGQPLGVTICYEDAFQEEVTEPLPTATVLVNLSEDAWFGDSLAPHQRLQMARSRALETGRPLVRASNNGLSALIAADGRILALAPQFQAAAVRGMVQPMQGTTPFVRYGNLLVVGLCLLLLLAGTSRRL